MGRLIDADLLMENYDLKSATKYGNKSAKQQEHSYSTLMMYEIADMIDDAPTAYDVEAVLDGLTVLLDLVNMNQKLAVAQAMDIVRRGGVK